MQGSRTAQWPVGLNRTVIRLRWFERISGLPPGLNLEQASQLLGEPYAAVRRWAVRFGYQFPDRRRTVSPEQWNGIDWTRRDADIARELRVTRECVRLVRKARGVGPSAARSATQKLEQFVATHRDRLHGLLVDEVIHHSGTDLPYHVVRRVLRQQQVQPHGLCSPMRQINWQLPNRDLASIWGIGARYIANLRGRLEVGPARWNPVGAATVRDPEYRSALSQERQKALRQRRNDLSQPPLAWRPTMA